MIRQPHPRQPASGPQRLMATLADAHAAALLNDRVPSPQPAGLADQPDPHVRRDAPRASAKRSARGHSIPPSPPHPDEVPSVPPPPHGPPTEPEPGPPEVIDPPLPENPVPVREPPVMPPPMAMH